MNTQAVPTASGIHDGFPVARSFAAVVSELRRIAPLMERIARSQAIEAVVRNGTLALENHPERMTGREKEAAGFLTGVWQDGGVTALEEVYVCAHFVAEGPKVFRPSAAECESLEQIDPRISVAEYRQPFPTMAVELPDSYRTTRSIPMLDSRTGVELVSRPVAVILHHEPDLPALFTSVLWDGGLSVVRALHHFGGLGTIAEILRAGEPPPGGSMPVSERERWLTDRLVCVAVNAMLLLTQYGHKEVGHDNKSYARRLERYVEVARRRKKGLEEARRNLRMLPVVYGFSQTVALREERTEPSASSETDSGRVMSAHWRRGHFRMQPFGPGRQERRLTFIRPVLVNRHLLAGGESRTSATYLSDPEDIRSHAQVERQRQRADDQSLEFHGLKAKLENANDENHRDGDCARIPDRASSDDHGAAPR